MTKFLNLEQDLNSKAFDKIPSVKAVADAISSSNLPDQKNQANKFLSTNGEIAEWRNIDLSSKQDILNTNQLNAVNSGITKDKVSKYDNYETSINDKASKTELNNGLDSKQPKGNYQTVDNLSQLLNDSITNYPSNKAVKDAIDSKDSLPLQTGNNGKFLSTNGKIAEWRNIDLSSKQDILNKEQLDAVNSKITSSKVSKYDNYETSINDKASKTELNNGLDSKQNNLSLEQLNAVNSGITSSKVSKYDGYETSINDKQPKGNYQTIDNLSQTIVDSTTNYPSNKAIKNYTYSKNEIDGKISGVFKPKGSVNNFESLPTQDQRIGDVWNVLDTGKNYVWTDNGWDDLGGTVDLSNYPTNDDLTNSLNTKQDILNTNQLNAVNSGITKDKVSIYNGYKSLIDGKADNDSVVHLTGNETINGLKSFTDNVSVTNTLSSKEIGYFVKDSKSDKQSKFLSYNVGNSLLTRIESFNPQNSGRKTKGSVDIVNENSGAIRISCNNISRTSGFPNPSPTANSGEIATANWVNTKLESVSGSIDQNTGKPLYDWVGTTAEYSALTPKNPDWLYYITDDLNEDKSDLDTKANIDLDNITAQGKNIIKSQIDLSTKANIDLDNITQAGIDIIKDNAERRNQNTGNPLFDWVGTKDDYEVQNISTTHPDWLCYIIDDVAGIPDTYTKNEVNSFLANKADKDFANIVSGCDAVIDYQANPDGSWYRQYKSGWLEQGGFVASDKFDVYKQVILLKNYKNNNYYIGGTVKIVDDSAVGKGMFFNYKRQTTNSFEGGIASKYAGDTRIVGFSWEAKGMGELK